MAEALKLEQVRIARGDRVLVEIDRTIAPGEVLTLMGPSGSGKSTLLAWMTGTIPPGFTTSGRLFLGQEEITDHPAHRRRLGILFQDDLLFPHMSVAQNLAFGLVPGGDRAGRIAEALSEVGLDGYGDRDPATLSGGQKARVALMRMLLSAPRALLLDEPFSRLDAALRAQVRAMVFERARARDLPVLMVTHDGEDAAAAGGDVVRLA